MELIIALLESSKKQGIVSETVCIHFSQQQYFNLIIVLELQEQPFALNIHSPLEQSIFSYKEICVRYLLSK